MCYHQNFQLHSPPLPKLFSIFISHLHPANSFNDLPYPCSPTYFMPFTPILLPFALRASSSHRPLSLQPSGLCWHVLPPHLVSFPLTLEQMAGPCSLCVSLTDRGRSSTSIWPVMCRAARFFPASCPLIFCSKPPPVFGSLFILASSFLLN